MASAFDNLAPRVMADLIRDLGITPEQAAGICGNIGAESRFLAVQEGAPTSGRGGWGWMQWTGSRRVAAEKWWRDNGFTDPTTYAAQYGFLLHELKGAEAKSLRQLKLTTTAKAAAETFGYLNLRFAGHENLNSENYANRIKLAERALSLYRAKQPTPPTPVPPMPTPPVTLPDSKPWWQSKAILTNIATLLAATPLFAKFFGGVDVSALTETLSTVAVLLGPILSSIFRMTTAEPIKGTPLSKQIEVVRDTEAAPVQESWRYDEPLTIHHVTDHNEVVRLATQLPWPEFAALAIKLTPMLLIAKEAAQKVVEQRPPPPPSHDPLDILRTGEK